MKTALLAFAALATTGAAHAANLFADPGFDSSTGGWLVDAGTTLVRDTGDDAAGNPASGSLAMSTSNGINGNLVAYQCVAVTGGQNYDFGTAVRLNTGDAAGMQCDAYASTDCSGGSLATAAAAGTPDTNWSMLSASGFAVPAAAQSVRCQLTASQPLVAPRLSSPTGFAIAVHFDNTTLQLGTPVGLQSFDVR